MKKSIIYLALFTFTCIACKSETNKQTQDAATSMTTQKATLAPISRNEIINMYETIDYIDYIFFNWDFSMNQSEPNAVKAAVTFISDVAPTSIPDDCKAVGRMVFQSKGEIIKEADLYYSDNCYFYSFVNEDNRPAYQNAMTDQGISFYQKMFAQALQPAQAQ